MEKFESIKKYMTTKLITFTPDTNIKRAIEVMLNNRISGAPVLNDKNELVGIVTEKDCLKVLIGSDYYDSPGGKDTVADYMSREIRTISSDKNVIDAAYEFIHSNYRRFPVLENGKLVGQISRRDVLRAVKGIQSQVKHNYGIPISVHQSESNQS